MSDLAAWIESKRVVAKAAMPGKRIVHTSKCDASRHEITDDEGSVMGEFYGDSRQAHEWSGVENARLAAAMDRETCLALLAALEAGQRLIEAQIRVVSCCDACMICDGKGNVHEAWCEVLVWDLAVAALTKGE